MSGCTRTVAAHNGGNVGLNRPEELGRVKNQLSHRVREVEAYRMGIELVDLQCENKHLQVTLGTENYRSEGVVQGRIRKVKWRHEPVIYIRTTRRPEMFLLVGHKMFCSRL